MLLYLQLLIRRAFLVYGSSYVVGHALFLPLAVLVSLSAKLTSLCANLFILSGLPLEDANAERIPRSSGPLVGLQHTLPLILRVGALLLRKHWIAECEMAAMELYL